MSRFVHRLLTKSARRPGRGEHIGPGDVARTGPGDGGHHARQPVGLRLRRRTGHHESERRTKRPQNHGLVIGAISGCATNRRRYPLDARFDHLRDVRGFGRRYPRSPELGFSVAGGAQSDRNQLAFWRSCRRVFQEYRLRSDRLFGELPARAANRRRASRRGRIHHAFGGQQHFVDHPRGRDYCRGDLPLEKMSEPAKILIEARDLTVGYGDRPVLEQINFQVHRGEVFAILGASGAGKSTLLKHLIGLYEPKQGDVLISGESLVQAEGEERMRILRKFGVLYQGGALFGSLTAVENVRLPLDEFTDLPELAKDFIALSKLRLVGLEAAATKLPADLSGGMQKRAAIARAIVMDPCVLFLDEPSAGLDPITSAGLDALIRELARGLGITFVMVTHELASIYAVADRVVVLDPKTR